MLRKRVRRLPCESPMVTAYIPYVTGVWSKSASSDSICSIGVRGRVGVVGTVSASPGPCLLRWEEFWLRSIRVS